MMRSWLRMMLAAAVGWSLTACTPQMQPHVPPTESPALAAEAFLPGDGATLPLAYWPAEGKARAVIVALHGFNDYHHAFDMPARAFAASGIATYAYDQRGFGASEHIGFWAAEENLISDLRQAIAAVRARHSGIPIYVLGESMGGAVVIAAFAQGNMPPVNGLILAAPAVWSGQEFHEFHRAVLWIAAHVMPGKKLTGEQLDILASDNIPMLRALARDPLVIKATRIDAVYGLVQLMDKAYRQAEHVRNIPVLLLYGACDEVIPPEPVHDFAARLSGDHRFIVYPQGWHMLLRDLQREVVWGDIIDWIKNPNGMLPLEQADN